MKLKKALAITCWRNRSSGSVSNGIQVCSENGLEGSWCGIQTYH